MRKITREKIINEIAAIAFSDYTRLMHIETKENGQSIVISDTAQVKGDIKKAVCSVKAGTKGIEIKLYDKLKALEVLGRIYGIYNEQDINEQDALDKLKELFETGGDFNTDS